MIPHIIHRMWLGPKPMPEQYRKFGLTWQILNPDWELRDWSWHDLPTKFYNQDVIDDLLKRASGYTISLVTALADVIAYELIYNYGGIYVNADIEPVRPFTSMFDKYELQGVAFCAGEWPDLCVNAVMGGPTPGYLFWKDVVHGLSARYFNMPNAEMNQVTGPIYLSEMKARAHGSLKKLPNEVFSPIRWQDIPPHSTVEDVAEMWDFESLPIETIGVHYWAHRQSMRSNIVS